MRNRTTAEGDIFIATFNEKNRTVSDEKLSSIFADVGRRYGYGDVAAEFVELTDFKVRWQRSYDWIRFTVSDYLDRAPDDALRNIAEVLFAKIDGSDREYDECFLRYVSDPKVVKANRKDFLMRRAGFSKTAL